MATGKPYIYIYQIVRVTHVLRPHHHSDTICKKRKNISKRNKQKTGNNCVLSRAESYKSSSVLHMTLDLKGLYAYFEIL